MTDSLGPRPFDFMPGYTNARHPQYMNIGYVKSPYPGKTGEGDWGPLQGGGIYYQPNNPTYPYPMNFSSSIPVSEQPTLAYEQDIPRFIRRQDMLKHGVAVVNTPPESNKISNRGPPNRFTSCGSCY
jgi:hypothetical protein